jgi:protocatechuate 3,4-dioxygenase beta subunit
MNRRRFLGASLGSLAFSLAGGSRLVLAQCPARTDPDIEGPFYRPNAPLRERLVDAPSLSIQGTVRDTRCRPMRDAVIEVWQADAEGEYDLTGSRFRGTLRTDARGAYRIDTIHPGRYLNGPTYRPSHIHVKVHANDRPPLTTQLYFPGDPHNDADPWMRSSLLLTVQPPGCHPRPTRARFDFIV